MPRLLSIFLVPLLFLLAFSAATPAFGQSAGAKLYVCNQGEATVSIIDMDTQTVEQTVDLKERGFSENAKPHHAVAEPDGRFWYVTLIGENTVLKFNRENEIVGRVSLEVPGLLALHPSEDLLYVGRSMSAVSPPQSVSVLDREQMEEVEQVGTFFPRPHSLAVRPGGEHAFVGSLASNQLLAFDTETMETELTRLGGRTQTFVQFAVSPDGQTLIAGGQMTGQLLVFDASEAPLLTATDTLEVGQEPWHPVVGRESGTAYVPNKRSHSISVIDLEGRSVEATIEGEGIAQPHGAVLSGDGEYLFVSNNNRNRTYEPTGENPEAGTVVVIETETREIVEVIEVGTYPTGIGTAGGQQVAAR